MTTRVLRLTSVIEITGLARSTIYQKIAENRFPPSIKLGPSSVGWLEKDVEAWIEQQLNFSDHHPWGEDHD